MSKALQLADELTFICRYPNVRITPLDVNIQKDAAAELRRLYAEVDSLSYQLAYPGNYVCPECDELRSANAELVEALQLADAAMSGANMNMNVVEKKVRAALAKAGEQP